MATLVRNGIVLPMTGARTYLDPGLVLIESTTVVAVGSVEDLDADPRSAGAQVVDVAGHVVLPRRPPHHTGPARNRLQRRRPRGVLG